MTRYDGTGDGTRIVTTVSLPGATTRRDVDAADVARAEPSHAPGPLARAMCDVAAQHGLGYYSAINGDAWSPDYPGLTAQEAAHRLADFERDCYHRGITDWRRVARALGHTFDDWLAED